MPKYKIWSGTLKATVEADTPLLAFKKALKKKRPKALGIIVSFTTEETSFAATENLLKQLGLWKEKENA